MEITEQYPDELREAAQLGRELEESDVSGKKLNHKQFAKVGVGR